MDEITKSWIRNPSDEAAAANGCRFDVDRGLWTVWWIERHCRLYEGEHAGEPLRLRGCAECDAEWPIPADFNAGLEALRDRAASHAECAAAGHALDWQFEFAMRLFGWVRDDDFWKREVRRFRQAIVFVAKKNKKSPTLAATGLYLLCGDGEPGQKVFPAAKDGNQVRDIVGQHAVKMVEQSPELSAECTINRNLMRITHGPSLSFLQPLSSANERTQESKEGLNGSVLIDELHVVDRNLANRVDRAGISRSEPLHIEVSTAGDNPDSYGKERFDHALLVERGQVVDEQLFVAIYAAPQDVSDAEIEADPLNYGRMANPAMGHTVNPAEYLADYQRSKSSTSAFSLFKKYRLNVWQSGSNPWLNSSDWAKGHDPSVTDDDLAGQPCVAALDLSKTRDFSALVYAFGDDDDAEVVRLIARFFLPTTRAKLYSDLPGWDDWQKRGGLHLTPGDVIDYGFVRSVFREDCERFDVQSLLYDPWHAEETTQTLEQGVVSRDGTVIEEGTGVPRVEFRQTIVNFAEPTAEFERRVIAGKIRHNNPILTWQAGHVQVKPDPNGNIRPVKPKSGGRQTIDGIVAAIMAFAGLLAGGGVQVVNKPLARIL